MTYAIRACRMGSCGSLGHESDFIRVISGANHPINISDGPCKVLGKSGTVGQAHDQSNRSYGRRAHLLCFGFCKDSVIRPLFGKLNDIRYSGLLNGCLW